MWRRCRCAPQTVVLTPEFERSSSPPRTRGCECVDDDTFMSKRRLREGKKRITRGLSGLEFHASQVCDFAYKTRDNAASFFSPVSTLRVVHTTLTAIFISTMSDHRQHEAIVIILDNPSFGTAVERRASDAVFKGAILGVPSVTPEHVHAMLNAVVEPPPDPSTEADTGTSTHPRLPSVAITETSEGIHAAAAQLGAMSLMDKQLHPMSYPQIIVSRASVGHLETLEHTQTSIAAYYTTPRNPSKLKSCVAQQMAQTLTPYKRHVLGVSTYISNCRLVVDTGVCFTLLLVWVIAHQAVTGKRRYPGRFY
ncbi:hypothetical protein C8Q78DRAFT_753519 [Trametes maxima]|nr:hypothetical protein C8Q78DRAFT_753519 [Trametes maxima]